MCGLQEPKLDNARRIVAEWPALDEEARAFTAKVGHHYLYLSYLHISTSTEEKNKMPGFGHTALLALVLRISHIRKSR